MSPTFKKMAVGKTVLAPHKSVTAAVDQYRQTAEEVLSEREP